MSIFWPHFCISWYVLYELSEYSTFTFLMFSGPHLQCLHVQLATHLDGHQLGLLAVLLLVDLMTLMSHNSRGCISLFSYRNHHRLGVVKDKLQGLI